MALTHLEFSFGLFQANEFLNLSAQGDFLFVAEQRDAADIA